jgi:hypothetical protein
MLFFKPRSPVSFSKKLLLLAYAILLATNRAIAEEVASPAKDAHVHCPIIVNCASPYIDSCVYSGGNPELFKMVQGATQTEIGLYRFREVTVKKKDYQTVNDVDCMFTTDTGRGGTLHSRVIDDHVITANIGEPGWMGNFTASRCAAGFDCTLLMRK